MEESLQKVRGIDAGAMGREPSESPPPVVYHKVDLGPQPEFDLNENTSEAIKREPFMLPRSPFIVKPAPEWMAERKNDQHPLPLFGDLWQEGELAVMLGERASGKSILAIQIAESLARGVPVEPFGYCPRIQRVLYFDLALSSRQFHARYTADLDLMDVDRDLKYKDPYEFSTRFRRAEIDLTAKLPDGEKDFTEYVLAGIEAEIAATGARSVIIDSIDRFNGEIMRVRDFAFVMNRLKRLQAKLGISILVVAELAKRSPGSTLEVGRLMSTRATCAFADSVFAIGVCRWDEHYRYIKHFRSGAAEMLATEILVPTFRILKEGENFLSFRFDDYRSESFATCSCSKHNRHTRVDQIKQLSASGISQRRIARYMEMSLGAVNRARNIWSPWDDSPVKAAPELIQKLVKSETPLAELAMIRPTNSAKKVERLPLPEPTIQDKWEADEARKRRKKVPLDLPRPVPDEWLRE